MNGYALFSLLVVVGVAFGLGYMVVSYLLEKTRRIWGRIPPSAATGSATGGMDTGEAAPPGNNRASANGSASQTREPGTGDNPSAKSAPTAAEVEAMYAEILELGRNRKPADIRRAYHAVLARYHPDKVSHLGVEFRAIAERKTKAIVAAYNYFQERYGL